jgi:hypothetical protein
MADSEITRLRAEVDELESLALAFEREAQRLNGVYIESPSKLDEQALQLHRATERMGEMKLQLERQRGKLKTARNIGKAARQFYQQLIQGDLLKNRQVLHDLIGVDERIADYMSLENWQGIHLDDAREEF